MVDLDLAQLRTLAAVVDAGSLDAAATRLHVTTSAVSQRLRALEVASGRVLLVRSRPVRVTASGEEVLRLARQVDLLVSDTATALGAEGAVGVGGAGVVVLPLAVSADSLATWVLPALAPLAGDLCVDLRREDEAATARLLRDGRVMGAVTADEHPVPGCSVTPLGKMRYRVVAAPAFVARWFAAGVTAEALREAPVVVFDREDHLQDRWLATRTPGVAQPDPPRHHVPSSREFADAVRLGFGWGLLPELQLADHPEEAFVPLVDDAEGADAAAGVLDVPLFWQQWRLRSPALDAVATVLVAAARRALVQPR